MSKLFIISSGKYLVMNKCSYLIISCSINPVLNGELLKSCKKDISFINISMLHLPMQTIAIFD